MNRRPIAFCAALATAATGLLPAAGAAAQTPAASPPWCLTAVRAAEDDFGPSTSRRCRRTAGYLGAVAAAATPDGAHVYLAAEDGDAIAILRRGAGGALDPAGCVSQDGSDGRPRAEGGCRRSAPLDAPAAVQVSPDGAGVHVIARRSNAVVSFRRDGATGALTRAACTSATGSRACADGTALRSPRAVALSPDGRHAYVAATGSDAVATFAVTAGGGLVQTACVSDAGTDGVCDDGEALREPIAVAVSPDGRNVYVAARRSNALTVFVRDQDTGALRQVGCFVALAPRGGCANAPALGGASAISISPDGAWVDVAGTRAGALVSFARDPAGGALTQRGCLAERAEFENTRAQVGALDCADGLLFDAPATLAALPGGRLLVGEREAEIVSVVARDPATGAPRRVACLGAPFDADVDCAPRPLDTPMAFLTSPGVAEPVLVGLSIVHPLTIPGGAR